MDALRTANVIESNAEGHVRLSEIGVSLVSRRLSLEVQEPFLFFAGRQGVPHHKSSILELMLELQSRGWVKRIDPPRPRHIRPFRHDASEDDEEGRKLFYSTSKTIPCRMYLTALLEGAISQCEQNIPPSMRQILQVLDAISRIYPAVSNCAVLCGFDVKEQGELGRIVYT